MTGAVALLAYAAVVGTLVPAVLRRATWTHRAPVLGVALWQGLALSFVVAVALAAHHLAAPTEHLHSGLMGLLHACGLDAASSTALPAEGGDAWRLLVPLAVGLWPVGWFAVLLTRSLRRRRRHIGLLDLVARRAPELDALVLDHDVPAAYCLPGRKHRVVLTRGALDILTPEQLRAVLEHERAHVSGRHHLAQAAAEAYTRAFPLLPLARRVEEETRLLLEMAADDRAVRHHSREALATAMYEVAAGQVPAAAFGAGGPAALIRLRRLLAPARTTHPATWLTIASFAVAVPVLPLLVACGPVG
ncbi:M56 family metallopeptidase [Kitasatospora sp. NPDC098652]|uniref:M56 family metallopeptidase n=1 Tax=Kitasatospora sp. NPDC098652 TaxID=3364095 RepID=UPI00382E588D